MITDNLTDCPKCGCDGCYKVPINETKYSYYCWGCGFQTNDLMVVGEFDIDAYQETLPELYKEVNYTDSQKRVWYPISINLETRGTVFLNGRSVDDVQWSAIKAVKLTEEEQKEPKYRGATYKSDAKSLKSFGDDFIEACDYIGLFENE